MADSYVRGSCDDRPWGKWEVLDCGETFCVKKIKVIPGGILSLQSHNFRSEHWIIVSGEAVVTLGEEKLPKKANESVFIPEKVKHRIQNNSQSDVVFIEVQAGENLDENDIIRYDDVYGRA